MSISLRETLTLLVQRTEKKFNMRVKRIKKTQPININTDNSVNVYCESETKTIIPKQINSDGLIIGSDLADSYSFNNLKSIEDKISIVEMIDNN